MVSRSFGQLITDPKDLAATVATFAGRAAQKLRSEGLICSNLTASLETNLFRTTDPQFHASLNVSLPVGTADTRRLTGAALRGLKGLLERTGKKHSYRFKRAGVLLQDLCSETQVQTSLLGNPDDARSQRLNAAVDGPWQSLERKYTLRRETPKIRAFYNVSSNARFLRQAQKSGEAGQFMCHQPISAIKVSSIA